MRGFNRVWNEKEKNWNYIPLEKPKPRFQFHFPEIEIPWVPIFVAVIIAAGVIGMWFLIPLIKIEPMTTATPTPEPVVAQTTGIWAVIEQNANAMLNDLTTNPINLIIIAGIPIIFFTLLGAFDPGYGRRINWMFRRMNWFVIGFMLLITWFLLQSLK